MKKKIKISDIVIFLIVLLFALSCLVPLLNLIALSFSDSASATAGRVGIIPVGFTLMSYKKLLGDAQYWRSLFISFERTMLGTALNIILVILMAYPLSKSDKEFKSRKIYMSIVLFAMLFNGGIIPTYIVVSKLGLLDTIWSLILPTAVGVSNVILMMNFFRGVPTALEEAAMIDGANPLQILIHIFVPAAKPCIFTVLLFCAVYHWNDYFQGIMYITKMQSYPLQSYIQSVSANFDISQVTDPKKIEEYLMISDKTLSSAKIVVSTVPLLLIFPLVSKYLTSGIVAGAVKE